VTVLNACERQSKVVPNYGSGKYSILPFFWNLAKPSFGQISSQICWNVDLITEKTNAAVLSTDVFAILISVTRTIKIHSSLLFQKFYQKLAKKRRNKGSTELYCLFIADDNIVDIISFIGHIVLWSQNNSHQIEFLNPARSSSCQIWNSQIPNSSISIFNMDWHK